MMSPFVKHRNKVLGHYSTAYWLRSAVLAMNDGSSHKVGLSNLATVDADHFAAFVEMATQYRNLGENDPEFLQLVDDIHARLAEEGRARERAELLDAWMRDVKGALRVAGKPVSLANDRYEWFSARFDSGFSPEAAAAACPPYDEETA